MRSKLYWKMIIYFQMTLLSEMERALVQAWTTKLLDASVVELSRGDYASSIMMPTNKDFLAIIGNGAFVGIITQSINARI